MHHLCAALNSPFLVTINIQNGTTLEYLENSVKIIHDMDIQAVVERESAIRPNAIRLHYAIYSGQISLVCDSIRNGNLATTELPGTRSVPTGATSLSFWRNKLHGVTWEHVLKDQSRPDAPQLSVSSGSPMSCGVSAGNLPRAHSLSRVSNTLLLTATYACAIFPSPLAGHHIYARRTECYAPRSTTLNPTSLANNLATKLTEDLLNAASETEIWIGRHDTKGVLGFAMRHGDKPEWLATDLKSSLRAALASIFPRLALCSTMALQIHPVVGSIPDDWGLRSDKVLVVFCDSDSLEFKALELTGGKIYFTTLNHPEFKEMTFYGIVLPYELSTDVENATQFVELAKDMMKKRLQRSMMGVTLAPSDLDLLISKRIQEMTLNDTMRLRTRDSAPCRRVVASLTCTTSDLFCGSFFRVAGCESSEAAAASIEDGDDLIEEDFAEDLKQPATDGTDGVTAADRKEHTVKAKPVSEFQAKSKPLPIYVFMPGSNNDSVSPRLLSAPAVWLLARQSAAFAPIVLEAFQSELFQRVLVCDRYLDLPALHPLRHCPVSLRSASALLSGLLHFPVSFDVTLTPGMPSYDSTLSNMSVGILSRPQLVVASLSNISVVRSILQRTSRRRHVVVLLVPWSEMCSSTQHDDDDLLRSRLKQAIESLFVDCPAPYLHVDVRIIPPSCAPTLNMVNHRLIVPHVSNGTASV